MQKFYIFTGINKDLDGKCREEIFNVLKANGATTVENPEDAEGMIVLGGDGTMMRAAHISLDYGLSFIGVNLGRVGFMTEIEKDEIYLLENLVKDNFVYEERSVIEVTPKDNPPLFAYNDAIIHADGMHLVTFNVSCNGKSVYDYRGDGVVFATPTGSTAYSMSAGGAVIDPALDCFTITPVCAQSLGARPMIFARDNELNVTVTGGSFLTVDGGQPINLAESAEISFKRSEKSVKLMKIKNEEFFVTYKKKLVHQL